MKELWEREFHVHGFGDNNNKQLLDEVFAIFGIIKVEVTVSGFG